MRFLVAPVALAAVALGDVITGVPDSAPPGFEDWTSPIVTPPKQVTGDGGWGEAVAKARRFVADLTIEEKVNVTTGRSLAGRCLGNTGDITRRGWTGLCLNDSPLGVRLADFSSAFPAAINAAATWDVDLIYERGKAMGLEQKGKGVNVALGPMTNLARAPAGGRNWEGFGGDAFLSGVGTVATVKGYQDVGVIACAKHLIANEQEHYRGGSLAAQISSSNIDDKTMHEVYAWPFAEAVHAGVGSVMCSYQKVNQTQACQNSKVMNGLLKEELNFQGFIVSDWAAMINGVQPALAGLDMNMPGFRAYGQGPQQEDNPALATNSFWGANLIIAVKNGSVPEARLDDMVTRTLAAWYKMGQDKGYPSTNFDANANSGPGRESLNEHVNVQADHYRLIRELGAASTILLKNTQNALPLDVNKLKHISIIGSDAGPNPDGPNGCSDRGCDQGTLAMGWGSGTSEFPYLIDPLAAIQSYIHEIAPTVQIEGVLNDFNYNQVQQVARKAQSVGGTCLVFVNADSGEGYLNVAGNQGDRNNLTLWHEGDRLVSTTAAICSKTVVVQHLAGPVLIESWIDNPNVTAVLNAGLPGQETGNAIVDVLFGKVSPSARLPYTMGKLRTDYPADVLYTSTLQTPQITYSEGLAVDYRWFDEKNITPRFEFGFGLSYTTFTYSGIKISRVRGRPKRQEPSVAPIPTEELVGESAVVVDATSVAVSVTAGASSIAPTASSVIASVSLGSVAASASVGASSAAASGSGSASTKPTTSATASGSPPIFSPIETHPGGPAELFETLYEVSFMVHNAGGVDGHEVSQLYLGFPPNEKQPPRTLRGFDRSFIKKGSSTKVTISLRRKDISVWDVILQKWVVPKGTFRVDVGSSSRKILLTGSFST